MVSEAEKRRVGALIRSRRQVLDLSQPEFAARVGASRNSVSQWENGRVYPLKRAGKIEAVLGISLSEPAGQLDFDPDDPDEVRIMSWTSLPVDRRQAMINELREARRAAAKTA